MSTLTLGNSRFQSSLTTYEGLAALPVPQPLGRRHRPIPHTRLVDAVREEADRRGLGIDRERFAVSKNGASLFAVVDLVAREGAERGTSLGFRNSTDSSLGLYGVAGSSVFVCDNLVMSGTMFALRRKNTLGLDLRDAMVGAFDRFDAQTEALDVSIDRLAATPLTDSEAKVWIYNVFAAGIAPIRLFDDVSRYYFMPERMRAPECEPRTLWGLHNAFTRAFRDLQGPRAFSASVALGAAFEVGVRA